MRVIVVALAVIVLVCGSFVPGTAGPEPPLEQYGGRPLMAPASLELSVPPDVTAVTLRYEQLSFGKFHSIEASVAGNRAVAFIPREHTTQPGVKYQWIVTRKNGSAVVREGWLPFIEEGIQPLGAGDVVAYDIERAGGYLDAWYLPAGSGRIPHNETVSVAPVTSKLLEVRAISGSEVHKAVDFGMTVGKNIVAMESGTVWQAAYDSGWGNYVLIEHRGNLYYTHYGHLDAILVKKGDAVSKGQVIGRSGNTGNTTGPHLDTGYNIYVSGSRVALYPFRWFMPSSTQYVATDFDYIQKPTNHYDYAGTYTNVNVYGKGSGTPTVYINYRVKATGGAFTRRAMLNISANTYSFSWPSPLTGQRMEYYIEAGKSTVPGRYVTRPAKFDSRAPQSFYEVVVGTGLLSVDLSRIAS